MKLVLLGTAGYHPNDTRQTASLMLPEVGVVLDAGTGFYRAAEYLCTRELDIFLSHAHLDHVVGITYLFDVIGKRKMDRVTVHARPEALAAIREHLLAEALFPAPLPCEFRPLVDPVPLAGGGSLSHFPLVHPGGASGFRLDWPGSSLAYVTDTTAMPGAGYLEAIRGANLLVHECNFADPDAELAARWGHSSASQVARLARDAGVGRLVLVHLNPARPSEAEILSQARAIFPQTAIGEDRLALEF